MVVRFPFIRSVGKSMLIMLTKNELEAKPKVMLTTAATGLIWPEPM